MENKQYFKSKVFDISSPAEFREVALQLFRFQYEQNGVYRQFVDALRKDPATVNDVAAIPHLPIEFFKSQKVTTGSFEAQTVFTSSGTSGNSTSRHHLSDLSIYERSFREGWKHFYEPIEEYCVIALLPAYLERKGSSLVYMADSFIKASQDPESGFYLDQLDKVEDLLRKKIAAGKKTLFLGVTFALLDLAEKCHLPPNDIVIMETGGMKGRRKEMIRSEVHSILTEKLGVKKIHSEYGMTELLSQAYSKGEGLFETPPWMQVSVRQTDDPLSPEKFGKTGGLNVTDLANIESCAFIATQDLARLHPDKRFEVMGRFDNADIRGCNLMVV